MFIWFLLPLTAWRSPQVVDQGLLHLDSGQIFNRWLASSAVKHLMQFTIPLCSLLHSIGHPYKCINSQCQALIPPAAPMCYYCGTPQQLQQQSAKKCISPQCGAPLLPKAMYCATCDAPQDPVRFQQLVSAAHFMYIVFS